MSRNVHKSLDRVSSQGIIPLEQIEHAEVQDLGLMGRARCHRDRQGVILLKKFRRGWT